MADALPEDELRFQSALDREILESERVRCIALASIFGICFVFFVLATTTFAAEGFRESFHGELRRIDVALLLGGVTAFEVMASLGIRRALREGIRPRLFLRYLTATIEICVPTYAIWMMGHIFHPLTAMLGPIPFLYFIFIIGSVLRLEPAISLYTGALAALQFLLLVGWAYSHGTPAGPAELFDLAPHRGRVFVLIASGALAAWVAWRIREHVLRNMLSAERERTHIFQVFGQHVSPAVVNRLLAQRGELPSEVRYVCVMFLDIRDFTSFAESRKPEDVVRYLNTLFGYMIDAVDRNHGIVNKFLGDGFMAVFGAPFSDGQECRNAIAAAREILAKTKALDAALPPPRIGIGLHAGEAVTGHVGSAERKEYTIIGDVVNLASRLESMNKELATQILASAEVVKSAGEKDATPRGPAKVKGRESTVDVFQLA